MRDRERGSEADSVESKPTLSNRLYYEDLDQGTVEFVRALYSDWDVSRHLSRVPFPFNRNDAEELVAEMASARVAGDAFAFVIKERSTDAEVGLIVLRRLEDLTLLGYSIIPSRWNMGYATEAAKAMTEFAFSALGASTIQASTTAENIASVRVLDKLGFKVHERDVLESTVHSGVRPVQRFRIYKEPWN